MESIFKRIRDNVRLLKAIRSMADEAIANAGGYTSRQVYYNRISGRTDITVEDLHRIAAALRVEPDVLMMPTRNSIMSWLDEHEDYDPPVYEQQEHQPNRVTR